MLLFSSVIVIEVVGILYWKIYGLTSQLLNKTNIEGHFTLTACPVKWVRLDIWGDLTLGLWEVGVYT